MLQAGRPAGALRDVVVSRGCRCQCCSPCPCTDARCSGGGAVLAAYVFLFGVRGTKTAMLAVVMLGAAALVSAGRGARFSHLFLLGISLLLAFPVIFDAFGEVGRELQRLYVSFVHARIFGVPQLVMAQYIGFFAQHPETAWSQVAGIGALVADPYDMALPVTLGRCSTWHAGRPERRTLGAGRHCRGRDACLAPHVDQWRRACSGSSTRWRPGSAPLPRSSRWQ